MDLRDLKERPDTNGERSRERQSLGKPEPSPAFEVTIRDACDNCQARPDPVGLVRVRTGGKLCHACFWEWARTDPRMIAATTLYARTY